MDDEPVRGSYPDLALLGLPGIERVDQRVRLFPRPPISHLVGLRPVQGSYGSVTFEMPASPWLQTSAGVFLAGTAALVSDAPLASVVAATLPPGAFAVTSDLSFNFLRPASVASERLVARAQLIDAGGRMGLSQALISDGHGQVLAHATSRCFVMTLDDVPDPSGVRPPEDPSYDTPDPFERPLTTTPLGPEVWNELPFGEIVGRSESGDLPRAPVIELFGLERPEVGEGTFRFVAPGTEWYASPSRTIFGGVTAFLLDNAMTGAMSSAAPTGSRVLPLDLKVNFLRPLLPDGQDLTVEGRVAHRGRNFLVASADVRNADGKVIATGTSSATVAAGPWAATSAPADEAVPEPG